MPTVTFQNNSVFEVILTVGGKQVAPLQPGKSYTNKQSDESKYEFKGGPLGTSVSFTWGITDSDAIVGFSYPIPGDTPYIAITNNSSHVVTLPQIEKSPIRNGVLPNQETWWFKDLAKACPSSIEVDRDDCKFGGTYGTFNLHVVMSKPQ